MGTVRIRTSTVGVLLAGVVVGVVLALVGRPLMVQQVERARRLALRLAGHTAKPTHTPSPPPLTGPRVDLRHLAVADLSGCLTRGDWGAAAEINALFAQEAFVRAGRVVDAWLANRDPKLGLLPRTLRAEAPDPRWLYKDCAADNYCHLVIAASLLFPNHLAALTDILGTERRLSPDLPRDLDLRTGLPLEESDQERLFGAVEYAKDGLLPIFERVGAAQWSDRLHEIVEQIMARSNVPSDFGMLPSAGSEKNGEMLQVLARLFHRDRNPAYLAFGRRIAAAYCEEVLPRNGALPAQVWDFSNHRPITASLRLRDHANEIVAGLVEWLIAEGTAGDSRAGEFRPRVEAMLDRLLDSGRAPDGMWRVGVSPSGSVTFPGTSLNDNWGYLSSAYVAYALSLPAGDSRRARYLAEARRALSNVTAYREAPWEDGSPDGYADTLEGTLYLLQVFDDREAALWVDDQIAVMFAYQQSDGFVQRRYLDGNFVRTSLLYGFFRTAGTWLEPFSPDARLGAQRTPDGGVVIVLAGDSPWRGNVRFDTPRHAERLRLPFDYPRLNGWPEWFVVEEGESYAVSDLNRGTTRLVSGHELRRGLPLTITAGESLRLRVVPARVVDPREAAPLAASRRR